MTWLLRRRERRSAAPAQELIEVVTPRTNAAVITPAEHLFAALALCCRSKNEPTPVSLEIAADHQGRRFVARAAAPIARRNLVGQLGAAYPQATLRTLSPEQDPALVRPGELVAVCTLGLRHPPHLPLRSFRDGDVDASRVPQADPVLGILAALADLPPGWRAFGQLVLRPAPADWSRPYVRLALEHPLAAERQAALASADTCLGSVFALIALIGVASAARHGLAWYGAHDWLHLAMLMAAACGLAGLVATVLWLRRPGPLHDPKLVQDKLRHEALVAEPRLAVVAPAGASAEELSARVRTLTAAYRPFTLAAGNALVARPAAAVDLRVLAPLGQAKDLPILNVRELAGLWHLPQALDDVALVERTTARRRQPLPTTVSPAPSGQGCHIGVSAHQGRVVPVSLPDALLRRHLLLVAKTRRGKSTLLLRLARHHMDGSGTLVLVDPHRDLAESALGLVPSRRRGDLIYLDVANRECAFGVNLLDAGLSWNRDQAVANTLVVFERAFDRFWGPRMADAFRFAAMALFEANEALCGGDPQRGRDRQYTVLDVPMVLADPHSAELCCET